MGGKYPKNIFWNCKLEIFEKLCCSNCEFVSAFTLCLIVFTVFLFFFIRCETRKYQQLSVGKDENSFSQESIQTKILNINLFAYFFMKNVLNKISFRSGRATLIQYLKISRPPSPQLAAISTPKFTSLSRSMSTQRRGAPWPWPTLSLTARSTSSSWQSSAWGSSYSGQSGCSAAAHSSGDLQSVSSLLRVFQTAK